MTKYYLFLTFLFFHSISLQAQTTCTWLGGNGNWNDPTKWSCGVVPGEEHDVVINDGIVTGNFYLHGQTPDEIIINGLTLIGGILESGSNFFIVGSFEWRGGRLRGSPEVNAHLYDGGGMTVEYFFSMTGAPGVDSLVFVNKRMGINGGGIWTDPPNLVLKNAIITMIPFYGFIPSLRIHTPTRDARITGYDDPANPQRSSCTFWLIDGEKTGSKKFTIDVPRYRYTDNVFNVNEGKIELDVNDNLDYQGNTWFGNPGTEIIFRLNASPLNTDGVYFRNFYTWTLGNVSIYANDPAITSQLMTFSGSLEADTLFCYGQYNNNQKAILTGAENTRAKHLILTGPMNIRGGFIDNYKQAEGTDLFCYHNYLSIGKANFTGGRLGGYFGEIHFSDSLFITDSLVLEGGALAIDGYAKFKNVNFPIRPRAGSTLPADLPLPPFTLFPPPASNPYAWTTIDVRGTVDMEIDTETKISLDIPESIFPSENRFTNWNTIRLKKPVATGPFAKFDINIPINNVGKIHSSFVDIHTAELNWTGPAEFIGRMNIDVDSNFVFSNPGTVPAKLNTAKLNLFGPQNHFHGGDIDMNSYGGILTNYGTVTTLCNGGHVRILNSSGDGRGYFSNYGQLIKLGVNSTIRFQSDVVLKNGRDMIIERGIVKATAAFNNLNLIRGYGTLDISQATSVTNTGTFTGGVTLTGIYTVQGNFDNSTLLTDVKGDNPMGGPPADKLVVTGNADISSSVLRVRERGNVSNGTSFVILECQGGPDCLTGTFSTLQLPLDYTVAYTGNSVILNKGELLTSAFRSSRLAERNEFRVTRLSATSYRIQSNHQNTTINLVDMNGKLVKKINISNYSSVVDLTGMAKGVLIALNVNTNEKVKFPVY